MKKDLAYLHDLLVKIDSRLDDMHEVQVRQEVVLEEHQRRSLANEETLEKVKKHVNMVQGVGAFLSILALIATIYAAIK